MAEVNPYVNTEGRTLTVYTQNGGNWSTSRLPSGMQASLTQDGSARNIWDSEAKTVKTSNRISGMAGWVLPSPTNAGDINFVNAIIINNSNIDHTIANNLVAMAGRTIAATLPLGVITLGSSVIVTNTVLSVNLAATNQSNPFQVLPLPDQIVTIGSGGLISISSLVLSRIPVTSLSIHNCFTNTLLIRVRPCDGALAQNFGQIQPNQTIRLSVYSTHQIFLESGDGRVVSGFFDVPTSSVSRTIFFRTNGAVSNISCSGDPIPPTPPGPTPPPPVPPLPPVKTFQQTWNTEIFPKNGTGACAGDTISAVSTSTTSTIPIRVNDTVQFVSSDGQSHNLVQTGPPPNWIPLSNQTFPGLPFPASTSFKQSITFTTAGCFFFISQPQSTRMRLRISITDTNGNGGCTTACPGIPDTGITPIVVVPTDDQSFLERWWWAILLCIIVIIIIIILLIWAFWPKGTTTTVVKTDTVAQQGTVIAQPALFAQPGIIAQPALIPNADFGPTGAKLVSAPPGYGLSPTNVALQPQVFSSAQPQVFSSAQPQVYGSTPQPLT